jgi:hypothetical protein
MFFEDFSLSNYFGHLLYSSMNILIAMLTKNARFWCALKRPPAQINLQQIWKKLGGTDQRTINLRDRTN